MITKKSKNTETRAILSISIFSPYRVKHGTPASRRQDCVSNLRLFGKTQVEFYLNIFRPLLRPCRRDDGVPFIKLSVLILTL
jgi:hypothetical protein